MYRVNGEYNSTVETTVTNVVNRHEEQWVIHVQTKMAGLLRGQSFGRNVI